MKNISIDNNLQNTFHSLVYTDTFHGIGFVKQILGNLSPNLYVLITAAHD